MTTNYKLLGAGLAVLVTGAVIGWSASNRNAIGSTSSAVTASADVGDDRRTGDIAPRNPFRSVRGTTVPSGTPLSIAVNTDITSKAAVGQTWHGEVTADVYEDGRLVIPAGSSIRGTVRVAQPAERGDRAQLQLGLSSITVAGRSYPISGRSELIVAGSPRARNVGAIAGGTAAGALLGKAIGGSTKGTVIGGVVGGAAATAAVAKSKGYQAKIDAGDRVSFTTTRSVTIRRS